MGDIYTVKKGDTLSEIAEAHLSLIGVTTITAGVAKLAELNNIKNVNYIVVGQKIKLNGDADTPSINTTSRATIDVFGLQSNTDRTVYATWTWSKTNTEHYRVIWYYDTGDGVWFIGNDSTVDDNQSLYTAPQNALRVKFKVKPISKKHKVNDVETDYWTAGWSTEKTYDFSNNPPGVPDVPTVSIEKNILKASLTNQTELNAKGVQFRIIKIDKSTSHESVYKVGASTIITTTGSYNCTYTTTVTSGYDYMVQCRSYRGNIYSDWSQYSSAVGTAPSTPSGFTTIRAASKESIYLAWGPVNTATKYTIEYTTESKYFDNSSKTTTVEVEGNEWIITGLDADEYFVRIRAANTNGESGWSKVSSVAIGEPPAAPTTWSSTTSMIMGEVLNLYWIHNSKDGSGETHSEMEIWIDKVYYNVPMTNPSKDDDEVVNSFVTIDSTSGKVVLKPWGREDMAVSFGFGFGATIEWRVRTAGVTNEFGDWSIMRTVNVYEPPELTVEIIDSNSNNLETISSFPFYIRGLAYPEEQTPTGYHLSVIANEGYETVDNVGNPIIVSAGDQVYSKYVDNYARSLLWMMSAGNINLENNISYTVKVTVSMDSGLTAESSAQFNVAWTDVEYEPNAEIGINPDVWSATIRPYCDDENGNPIEGISLSVYRREFDGTFTELATRIDNEKNTFITDPHPSLDYARYRVIATMDATGAMSYYDVPGYPVGGKAIVLQWDETWSSFDGANEDVREQPTWAGSMLLLPYNIDVSDSNNKDVSMIEYIGRDHPVSYYGTQIGSTATWSVDIDAKDVDTLYALRRLSRWQGNVYVREPSGSGYWACVAVSFSRKHGEVIIPVTLNITRVEGGT